MSTAPRRERPDRPAGDPGTGGVGVGAALVTAVGTLVVAGIGLTLWRSGARELPVLPWSGLIPLVLAAVLVLGCGWRVRRSVRTPAATTSLPSPQWARGALVAAQACALGGAALLGWYAANAAVHLPNLDVASVRDLIWRATVSAGAALLVSVSGFVAQAWCRLPPMDEDRPQDPGGLVYG